MAGPPNVYLEMDRTNVLSSLQGYALIRHRWPRRNQYQGLPPGWINSTRVSACIDAVNLLQLTRDSYVMERALAVPLQFLHDSLPSMVQKDVYIQPPYSHDFWHNADYKNYMTQDKLDKVSREYYDKFTTRPYQFWPVDFNRVDHGQSRGPYWGLIVLHLKEKKSEEPQPYVDNCYTVLESYAVIYPDHGQEARDLENAFEEELLFVLEKIGIDVKKAERQNPWVPPR